ncbi:MAG: LPS-assembly protein LptD, partial [Alphaproteobacteria bacterium]
MRAHLAIGLLVLSLGAAPVARAIEPIEPGAPVVVRADELAYDQKQGLVVATGNVEIAQGERILLADKVTYNEKTDTVTASGNVSLLEPSGEVLFADHIELTDEMKSGIVRDIRVLLTDDSRFAANGAVRSGGNRTEMRKAVFSPCKLCPDHPDRPPLWQLKAVRVVHDQRRQDIEYTDVFLELFGVPVAYAPFFTHPDPTVKRRSGFLTPTYGNSSQLGFTLQVPYYFNLAPHRDATFEPIFTSREGVVLAGEYRERTTSGQFEFAGSITRPRRRGDNGEIVDGRDTRGHIEGVGRFDLSDTWRWGYQLERTTDDTYLRRYGFGFGDTLTTNLYLERFSGRNYAAINGYAFQGLEIDDDPGETPLILPIADYQYISDGGAFGGHYTLDANLMSLSRTEGTDSRRLSLTGGWQLPYLGPVGDIYTITASLRSDLYWVNGVNVPGRSGPSSENGLTGRFVPTLALDWRYPWVRRSGSARQVIEPVMKFAVSPHGGNPDEIPNEDSQDFEFDDTNLLSLNRFPGLDRVEGGPRLSYGVRLGAYWLGGGRTTAFIGQSFRAKADSTFDPGSGLEEKRSDFVGRVEISPG